MPDLTAENLTHFKPTGQSEGASPQPEISLGPKVPEKRPSPLAGPLAKIVLAVAAAGGGIATIACGASPEGQQQDVAISLSPEVASRMETQNLFKEVPVQKLTLHDSREFRDRPPVIKPGMAVVSPTRLFSGSRDIELLIVTNEKFEDVEEATIALAHRGNRTLSITEIQRGPLKNLVNDKKALVDDYKNNVALLLRIQSDQNIDLDGRMDEVTLYLEKIRLGEEGYRRLESFQFVQQR